MLEDNTPHAFITELFTLSSMVLQRDRVLVKEGKWLIHDLSKPNMTTLATLLVNSKIKYTIKKSKVYGDVFSFTYSNVTYAVNCKSHILTVYFNTAKIR